MALVLGGTPNPWVTPGQNLDPPPPIPDSDRDGLPDRVTLRWTAQPGVSIAYDVLRGSMPGVPVGLGEESCAAPATTSSSPVDSTTPAPGGSVWYLVRARNLCGPGPWGQDSAGETRNSAACP